MTTADRKKLAKEFADELLKNRWFNEATGMLDCNGNVLIGQDVLSKLRKDADAYPYGKAWRGTLYGTDKNGKEIWRNIQWNERYLEDKQFKAA